MQTILHFQSQPMRPSTNLIVVAIAATTLTSCTSYKDITKKNPINKEFLSQLKVNKRYKLYLNSGAVLKVRVDSIENERVYGRMWGSSRDKNTQGSFNDSFDRLSANVTKISRKKFNPYLTVLAVAIPVSAIALYGYVALENGML